VTTRRVFLKGMATVAAAPVIAQVRQTRPGSRGTPVFAYVGTYSSPQASGGGRGEGIYQYEMNRTTGALERRALVATAMNPAWLALDASRTHLYSANEVATPATGSGSVSAYAIDRASGQLSLLNTVSSEGAGPAHMSVHPSGLHAFVANYAGGTVAVLPIRPTGELGAATDIKRHEGTVGPARATSAPPGSFAISGHDRPHAHMIQPDPSGRFVLSTDLGLDRIFIWRFDPRGGTLTPNDPPSVALPPGDGPRHFAFHPNGRWLYSLQEEASTLVRFDYDPANGTLEAKQTVSSLPQGFAGTNFTSQVMVSPDARFLYAANRLHDSIAWFSIGARGTLTFAGEEWTRGDYPRHFNIDPTANFLFSCNQRADAIAGFRINRDTGQLRFTGQYTPVGTPASIVFVA
jgi:6-phosphogluconolactonase